jgi:hypothetical protein
VPRFTCLEQRLTVLEQMPRRVGVGRHLRLYDRREKETEIRVISSVDTCRTGTPPTFRNLSFCDPIGVSVYELSQNEKSPAARPQQMK